MWRELNIIVIQYLVGLWVGLVFRIYSASKGFDILNTIGLCLVNTIVLWYVFSQLSIILDVVGEEKAMDRKFGVWARSRLVWIYLKILPRLVGGESGFGLPDLGPGRISLLLLSLLTCVFVSSTRRLGLEPGILILT